MQYFKTPLNTLLCTTAIMCTPCFADFYAGGSLGLSTWDDKPKSEGTAFEIYGGFRFSEYIGVEIALTDPGSFDYDFNRDTTISTDISGANYSLVLSYPLADAYGLYAKIGILDYELKRSLNDHSLGKVQDQDINYALGFEFNAVDNLFVTFDYHYYPLSFKYEGEKVDLNADTFSVGARFVF
jgi:OmpA-OmpF porin, OOP family